MLWVCTVQHKTALLVTNLTEQKLRRKKKKTTKLFQEASIFTTATSVVRRNGHSKTMALVRNGPSYCLKSI